MSVVFLDGQEPEVVALLARRTELGQDGHDEVWEGVLHVVPHASRAHAHLQYELAVHLGPRVEAAGYVMSMEFNLGDPEDFRVPDLGIFESRGSDLFTPSAVAVIEVLSPRDKTFEKFDFYFRHHVHEILVVDPLSRSITCWHRDIDSYGERDVLDAGGGIMCSELADQIWWP